MKFGRIRTFEYQVRSNPNIRQFLTRGSAKNSTEPVESLEMTNFHFPSSNKNSQKLQKEREMQKISLIFDTAKTVICNFKGIDNNRHRCCTALPFGPPATPG